MLIETGTLPSDARRFTIGEAATRIRGVRNQAEEAWLRMGTLASYLIKPHLKNNNNGPKAQDFNPYARRGPISNEEIKEVLELINSDTAKKLIAYNMRKKQERIDAKLSK